MRTCIFKVSLAAVLLTAAAPAFAQDADAGGPAYQDAAEAAAPASFQDALSPYGEWADSPQYGRIWIPAAARDPLWQPYTAGQWVYTEEYGWYFVSDDAAEPYGWIVYHYGRWLDDGTYGWIWIPGEVWGPAWVAWRDGDGFVGWAPLPPDDAYDVAAVPQVWAFVASRAFLRPDIRSYCFPHEEAHDRFRDSRYEDRSRRRDGSPIGHDAGIPPGAFAAASGLPVRPYSVRPRLYPGTVGLVDGKRVTAADRDGAGAHREIVRERETTPIEPVYDVPAAQHEPRRPAVVPTLQPTPATPAIRPAAPERPVASPPAPAAAQSPQMEQATELQKRQREMQIEVERQQEEERRQEIQRQQAEQAAQQRERQIEAGQLQQRQQEIQAQQRQQIEAQQRQQEIQALQRQQAIEAERQRQIEAQPRLRQLELQPRQPQFSIQRSEPSAGFAPQTRMPTPQPRFDIRPQTPTPQQAPAQQEQHQLR